MRRDLKNFFFQIVIKQCTTDNIFIGCYSPILTEINRLTESLKL